MDGQITAGTVSAQTGTAASQGTGTTSAAVQTGAGTAQGAPSAVPQTTGTGAGGGTDFNSPEFQRFVQAAVDRATNKLGNDNKALREQLDALQQAKLSDDELKEAKLSQREKDIAEREVRLKTEQSRMYALTKIKAAGLDDGSEAALGLIDLVMADDEKGIDVRVESLNSFVKKLVTAEVNKTFAANGRQPNGSNAPEPDKKDGKNAAAIDLGKKVAATNKESQDILNLYTGGKR